MKIGVIGGGQLAQMMALAGVPLGLELICLEPTKGCPAEKVTQVIHADYADKNALNQLAKQVSLITYEFENVDVNVLEQINSIVPIHPAPAALRISQDRLLEKNCFDELKIPTTRYIAVNAWSDLVAASEQLNFPFVLKTRRLGYDGKGQAIIRSLEQAKEVWSTWNDTPSIAESFIEFDREVSLIAVRNQQNDIRFYPLTINIHKDGILFRSVAPDSDKKLTHDAMEYITRLLQAFNYVGVLTVEFFVKGSQLIANEMAPRVHNSGHWTIEGAVTSQFENHLRAVANLPLGDTAVRGAAAMFNLVGSMPAKEHILQIPDVHLHDYGKAPRPGRKLGHVTLCADSLQALETKMLAVQSHLFK